MNALTLLKQDHHNVENLFKRFEQLSEGDLDSRRSVVDTITEQLAIHAGIEEQVLYPAVRAAVPDAIALVLESLEEHHIVKWTLSELEGMAPTDERFTAKVTVLIESVRHHVSEEEDDLFPKIRQALTNEQLEELGTTLEEAKKTAPVRPHPRQPDTPPLNLLLGVPVAAVDRVWRTGRDAMGRVLKHGA